MTTARDPRNPSKWPRLKCQFATMYLFHAPTGMGGGGGLYTREMGTICPFGVFSPVTVFVASKLTIFALKKDKWWSRGSKTPKPPEMPIKPWKTSQHHNWPHWPQIGPKRAIKQGKKRQKDKWYQFRAPTCTGGPVMMEPCVLLFFPVL